MNELLLLLRPLLRPSPLTPPRLLVLSTHSGHLYFVWSNNYLSFLPNEYWQNMIHCIIIVVHDTFILTTSGYPMNLKSDI